MEVNYFFIVYVSLFLYLIFFVGLYNFFLIRNKVPLLPFPFFLLLGLNLSDGNHSALDLLHLGQHSLDAGQDLVLVRRHGDADASHVPARGRDANNSHIKRVLRHYSSLILTSSQSSSATVKRTFP